MDTNETINRGWVLQALRETVEHIQSAIAGIEAGNTDSLEVWMPFIYLDLNRAWNGRYLQPGSPNFGGESLDQFPSDVDLSC